MKKFFLFICVILIICAIVFSSLIINYQKNDFNFQVQENEMNIVNENEIPSLMPARMKVNYSREMQNTVNEIEKKVLEYTNEERMLKGLSPLIENETLSYVARLHSEDMCTYAYFNHTDSLGRTPTDRVKQYGFSTLKTYKGVTYDGVAENICAIPYGQVRGYGYVDMYDGDKMALTMVLVLLDSEGHRKNMLNEVSTHVGIGVVYGYGCFYLTQEFW